MVIGNLSQFLFYSARVILARFVVNYCIEITWNLLQANTYIGFRVLKLNSNDFHLYFWSLYKAIFGLQKNDMWAHWLITMCGDYSKCLSLSSWFCCTFDWLVAVLSSWSKIFYTNIFIQYSINSTVLYKRKSLAAF